MGVTRSVLLFFVLATILISIAATTQKQSSSHKRFRSPANLHLQTLRNSRHARPQPQSPEVPALYSAPKIEKPEVSALYSAPDEREKESDDEAGATTETVTEDTLAEASTASSMEGDEDMNEVTERYLPPAPPKKSRGRAKDQQMIETNPFQHQIQIHVVPPHLSGQQEIENDILRSVYGIPSVVPETHDSPSSSDADLNELDQSQGRYLPPPQPEGREIEQDPQGYSGQGYQELHQQNFVNNNELMSDPPSREYQTPRRDQQQEISHQQPQHVTTQIYHVPATYQHSDIIQSQPHPQQAYQSQPQQQQGYSQESYHQPQQQGYQQTQSPLSQTPTAYTHRSQVFESQAPETQQPQHHHNNQFQQPQQFQDQNSFLQPQQIPTQQSQMLNHNNNQEYSTEQNQQSYTPNQQGYSNNHNNHNQVQNHQENDDATVIESQRNLPQTKDSQSQYSHHPQPQHEQQGQRSFQYPQQEHQRAPTTPPPHYPQQQSHHAPTQMQGYAANDEQSHFPQYQTHSYQQNEGFVSQSPPTPQAPSHNPPAFSSGAQYFQGQFRSNSLEQMEEEAEEELEGLNGKIVDAALLQRVQQIIEEHERQQKALIQENEAKFRSNQPGHSNSFPSSSPVPVTQGYSEYSQPQTTNQNHIKSSNHPASSQHQEAQQDNYTPSSNPFAHNQPQSQQQSNNLQYQKALLSHQFLETQPISNLKQNQPEAQYGYPYKQPTSNGQTNDAEIVNSRNEALRVIPAPQLGQHHENEGYTSQHQQQPETPKPVYGIPLAPVIGLDSNENFKVVEDFSANQAYGSPTSPSHISSSNQQQQPLTHNYLAQQQPQTFYGRNRRRVGVVRKLSPLTSSSKSQIPSFFF